MGARAHANHAVDSLQTLILKLYFFWANYGALTRGTAALGFALLVALASACHLPVRCWCASWLVLSQLYMVACLTQVCCCGQLSLPLPRGVQIDWEAILTPRSDDFVAAVRVSSLVRCPV